MRLVRRTASRFLVTGVLVNLALFGVLELLVRAGTDYRVAVTVVYVMGMVWGYAQNRLWSWESRTPLLQSFARYLVVYAVLYVAHLLCVMLLVEGMSLPPSLAGILSACMLVLPIFLLLDRFVFARKSP